MSPFPRTIATGNAFCNRALERDSLTYNIENIQHTVVVSPRRYGKTSLILNTLTLLKQPYAHADLFLAFETDIIIERILDSIASLIAKIIPITVKAVNKIKQFFSQFSLSIAAGNIVAGLKITAPKASPSSILKSAFESLEKLLKKHKQTAVFFIDEIQDIVNTPFCNEFEAILRFYAQKTDMLAFIFSGSNRRLLAAMFDDRSRPLFKLCEKLYLRRIEVKHYQPFIQRAAKKRWGKPIKIECIDQILKVTECHSYYVNYLCATLWKYATPPSLAKVNQAWTELCQNEFSNLASDIAQLSLNQKKLLTYIAQLSTLQEPTAKKHQQALNLTARGLQQSLKGLLEKNLIEPLEDKSLRIIDPMLRRLLYFQPHSDRS